MFKSVSPKVNFPDLEENLLNYWKENKTFEKSISNRPEDKLWTFLDGPPFVTGMPHYGHLLGSIHKDIFGRFMTMKGYRVPRVWGWDGHGLPIENKVEGKLAIKRKKDIEEVIGVKTFIEECKIYVEEISGEWEWYVDHIGRWVDFKNAYKTWDTSYMESVMWVFKQMYEKNYIYKGFKVSLYCPHCVTPISNFEVAMDADNYKEIADAGTTYKYELKTENLKQKTYILAWSTTPWNKIVTPALAVNPKLTYVKVKQHDEEYILAESTIKMLTGEYEVVEKVKGTELIGLKFVPHYDYYKIADGEKAFEIIGGDFVTAEEGTGVVTIAAYGEEDLKVMKEQNVHIEMHVDEEGTIKPEVPLFGGMYYLKANKAVNDDLSTRGLIYKDEEYLHKVPLCWRCHTRLYYAPINAWYVNIQELKPLMKETNEKVNWFPKHFKHGRFLKSLENAPDWNISRNRYWGSPVPVWECSCGERFVPGSIKELEDAAKKRVTDLHKPEIDEVEVPCICGKSMKRVPEVLDSWIEAGSASFAERHFPFNDSQKLEDFYPPDFIAEYTGQIRAWFYVLHVIGAALYKTNAFKNVGVEGVILGTDGRKMSKNLKNYPDPKDLLEKFGGDALRLYLMSSPVMHGEDMVISEEQYRNQVRGTMLILWNVYNFFVNYAMIDNYQSSTNNSQQQGHTVNTVEVQSKNILDEWILAQLETLVNDVTLQLDGYNTVTAIEAIQRFVTELSTWYLRRSRDRVGPAAKDAIDKQSFYETMHYVLITLCKVMAPITPFISEEIYRNLTSEESVHLTDWPIAKPEIQNRGKELEIQMNMVRELVEHAHAIRKQEGIKVRQPLSRLVILEDETGEKDFIKAFDHVIKDELNIKEITYGDYKKTLDTAEKVKNARIDNCSIRFYLETELTPELIAEGEARDIVRKIQEERKKIETKLDDIVDVVLPIFPEAFADYIKENALVGNLTKGDSFEVKKVN